MVDEEKILKSNDENESFELGKRSITGTKGISRFELLEYNKNKSFLFKPFFYIGFSVFIVIFIVLIFFYVNRYILPPMQDAVRVGEVKYSRGDVVNFIRFNQRISEDLGMEFEIGNSLFEALRMILEAELAYQIAPKYGISVSNSQVDNQIEFLMGFISETSQEKNNNEYKQNVAETYRQFLNKTGLSDYEYKNYVKRSMFREELRNLVARDVSRIQPHVNVYELVFESPDLSIINTIERKLTQGVDIEEIVLEFTEDKQALRNQGNIGWIPKGVDEEIDKLLFNISQDGKLTVEVGSLTKTPHHKTEENVYSFYYISDFSEAREIEESNFEKIADLEFEVFINSFNEDYNLWMDIDSEIYNWINTKVLIASNSEFLDARANDIQ
ncbi:MAG: hypothetical protein GWO78_05415 [Dehalococcoidales bacterium]|jgi:hypothetical protein|nr:SurA N-terminal domain-containing protein [Dehalococcoidia bacterium]NCG35408.1 hypothetical protein [Dehalococcoidales bacterium]